MVAKARPRNGQRGYTLVELMVTLSILSLIVGLALPRLGLVPTGIQVADAEDALAAAFRAASSLAAAGGHPVVLTVDWRSQQLRIAQMPSPDPELALAGPPPLPEPGAAPADAFFHNLRLFALPPDAKTRDQDEEWTYLFFPDGEATGLGHRYRIGGRHFILEVDRLTGRPAVVEHD